MAEKMSIEAKKVITPMFRVSFPQVFKPKAFESQEPKYSIVMLFDKKADLKALRLAAENAATEKWGDKTKWPKTLRLPFKDGNEKAQLPGYEDTIVVSASSQAKYRPGVVDQARSPITEEDGTFYAGCYARAQLLAFAYDMAGNKGVSFALQNVQKMKDGEPFSGRKAAEDVFDSVEETDSTENFDDLI